MRGKLVEAGWGATLGYPGLILDLAGAEIAACVFTSPVLPDFWPVLDAFEGAGYRRVATRVQVGTDEVTASIYVIAD